jgi:adenosylcobinamide-GDP ribazoletransferase
VSSPTSVPRPDAAPPADATLERGHPLGGLRAALMLLTRVPVGRGPLSPAARRWGAAFFPVAGGMVGAVGAAVLAFARPPLGDLLAACLAVLATCLLTGALHEDGLADTADALGGGGGDRERVLAILKDSRHGTYGVLALAGSLLLRVLALARLGPLAPLAWLLTAILARSAVVWLMARLPYVTAPRVARSQDAARAGLPQLAVAGLLAAALATALVLLPARPWLRPPAALPALAAAAVIALFTAGAGWWFRRRMGGITGDFLGATEQLNEVGALLTLALLTGWVG